MKLGIITDIHEDIVSLRLAMKMLEKKGCNEIACLGDITGFEVPYYSYFDTRSAHDCLAIVKTNCSIIVTGNHDLFSVEAVPNHQGGFNFPDHWYDLDFEERKILASNKVWLYEPNSLFTLLGRAEKEFLASLREYAIFETADHRILLSHSMFPDPTGSTICGPEELFNMKQHFQTMHQYKCTLSFSGHFHPGGSIKLSENDFLVQGFGKTRLNGELQHFVCPCVAQGESMNGVMIFDTSRNEIESIPLKSKNLKQVLHEKG